MPRDSRSALAAIALTIGIAGGLSHGQGTGTGFLAEQIQRQFNQQDAEFRNAYFADTPISERLLIDGSGSFRYAFNSIDTSQSVAQYLNTFDTRLSLRMELDGMHRFYGRLRFLYNDWSTPGSIGPDEAAEGWQDPIGEIYWYELDLGGAAQARTGQKPESSLSLRGGRQYIIWAQGVALSGYMYALTAQMNAGPWSLQFLAGQTAGNDTIDWDISRPGFDTDTDRNFYGGMVTYTGLAGHAPFLYVLTQTDGNAGQVAMLPAGAPIAATTFDYASTYVGLGSVGSLGADLVYRGELVYEFGTTLSDPLNHSGGLVPLPQVDDPISAFGMVLGGTRLWRDTNDSRLDLQMALGTGDSQRIDAGNTFGGIAPNQTDHSFNSLGYINTGLVLAPDLANLGCPSVGYSTNPFPGQGILRELRIGVTGYLFFKLDSEAPLSVPTNVGGSNFVGAEIDFNVDWRLTSDTALNLKYGVFSPNASVFAPSEDEARQVLYAAFTYSF